MSRKQKICNEGLTRDLEETVAAGMGMQFDEIGYWSEIKLDIIREYAVAYSHILSAQPLLQHIYVDAFAGAGMHLSKTTGDPVLGSPLVALDVQPPFKEYHFIELDVQKADALRTAVGGRPGVHVHEGDCNTILPERIFPRVLYKDYRRALLLLDPYGLHLNWEVIREAGQMQTVDVVLNFPIADINRNVLLRKSADVDEKDVARMNTYWGDDSWRDVAYQHQPDLFGDAVEFKMSNTRIADGFRERLREVAGFRYVPKPIPMRNSQRAIIYYLFFASHNAAAAKIAQQIFNKYRNRGVR